MAQTVTKYAEKKQLKRKHIPSASRRLQECKKVDFMAGGYEISLFLVPVFRFLAHRSISYDRSKHKPSVIKFFRTSRGEDHTSKLVGSKQ
jgi:hypothetical protein